MAAAAAMALWIVGGTLVLVHSIDTHLLGQLGLWLSGLGAVLWIRRMVCRLTERERNAFELGRDHERARDIRSIP